MSGVPSVAFAVRDDQIPTGAESCWDLAELTRQKIDEGEAWLTVLENHWQRQILERARTVYAAPALDYLFSEISVLAGPEIAAAVHDLDRLRSILLSDISIFRQLGLRDENPIRALSENEIFESARQAVSNRSVDDGAYRNMAAAFFSFLASQQQVLMNAEAAGMSLVHVQFHG
jgi:hypothetical protein